MELNDLEYLKSVLDAKMKKDIEPAVEKYLRSQESKKNPNEIGEMK